MLFFLKEEEEEAAAKRAELEEAASASASGSGLAGTMVTSVSAASVSIAFFAVRLRDRETEKKAWGSVFPGKVGERKFSVLRSSVHTTLAHDHYRGKMQKSVLRGKSPVW